MRTQTPFTGFWACSWNTRSLFNCLSLPTNSFAWHTSSRQRWWSFSLHLTLFFFFCFLLFSNNSWWRAHICKKNTYLSNFKTRSWLSAVLHGLLVPAAWCVSTKSCAASAFCPTSCKCCPRPPDLPELNLSTRAPVRRADTTDGARIEKVTPEEKKKKKKKSRT